MKTKANAKSKSLPLALVTVEDAINPAAELTSPKLSKAETITALVARALAVNRAEHEAAGKKREALIVEADKAVINSLAKKGVDLSLLPEGAVDVRQGAYRNQSIVVIEVESCPEALRFMKLADAVEFPRYLNEGDLRKQIKAKLDGHSVESPRIQAVLNSTAACAALDAALDALQ